MILFIEVELMLIHSKLFMKIIYIKSDLVQIKVIKLYSYQKSDFITL